MGTAKGSAKLGQQVHSLSSRGREKCVYRLIERGSIQIRARLGKPIHLCVKEQQQRLHLRKRQEAIIHSEKLGHRDRN